MKKTDRPKTFDIISMSIVVPRFMRLKDEAMNIIQEVKICNHCKGILGFG